jgi:hypothetical protein
MKEECRRELLMFAAHADSLGVLELLLPLLYVDVQGLDPHAADEAVALVARTQREDWRELRFEDEDSPAYRAGINRLTRRLVEIGEAVDANLESSRESQRVATEGGEADEPGLLDIMAEAEEAMPRWEKTIVEFGQVLETIGAAADRATQRVGRADATGKGFAGRLAAVRGLARELDDPARRTLELGTSYASDLVAVDAGVLTVVRMADEGLDDPDERRAACELFESVRGLATASAEAVSGLATLVQSLEDAAGSSRDLRRAPSEDSRRPPPGYGWPSNHGRVGTAHGRGGSRLLRVRVGA